MREGYTTGSCATAAALAATMRLLTGERPEKVTIHLPINREATFTPVDWMEGENQAQCAVVKDAGDDPDVTHGAHITTAVSWRPGSGIDLKGGEGVGTVTRPGLGLEVGGPAINPVPRRMILDHLAAFCGDRLKNLGLEVIISVPGGQEIAQKTLNGRLGIVGGISILGTKGIVRPYSTSSWRASVVQAVQVAAANGCKEVALTTGGRSEKFAIRIRPDWDEVAFVEMGIFTGGALRASVREGIGKVLLCGMVGKFAKLAQGHMQTHVAGNQVDPEFLAQLAAQSGAQASVQATIRQANTARHFQEILQAGDLNLARNTLQRLCEAAGEQCFAFIHGRLQVEAVLFDFDGTILGRSIHPRE